MTIQQHLEESKQRFDSKFSDVFENRRGVAPLATHTGIKDFITQRELALLKLIRESVEGMRVEHLDTSDPSLWGKEYTLHEKLNTLIHNRAVDKVLSILDNSMQNPKNPMQDEDKTTKKDTVEIVGNCSHSNVILDTLARTTTCSNCGLTRPQ